MLHEKEKLKPMVNMSDWRDQTWKHWQLEDCLSP